MDSGWATKTAATDCPIGKTHLNCLFWPFWHVSCWYRRLSDLWWTETTGRPWTKSPWWDLCRSGLQHSWIELCFVWMLLMRLTKSSMLEIALRAFAWAFAFYLLHFCRPGRLKSSIVCLGIEDTFVLNLTLYVELNIKEYEFTYISSLI